MILTFALPELDHINLPYNYLGFCPASNPYAYYNGKYCCNENEEKPNGTESQIEDGTCDGLDFNRKSECCSGDIYNTNNAYDNSAGMYILYIQSNSSQCLNQLMFQFYSYPSLLFTSTLH